MTARPRSLRPEVRNPVLCLPAMVKMRARPTEDRQAMADLLMDLSADARQRAETSWRRHKAPMALYWKVVAVYAGHTARAIRPAGTAAGRGGDVG